MRGAGLVTGALGALALAATVTWIHGPGRRPGRPAHPQVAEDAGAPLRSIAIHYAPMFDDRVNRTWRELFAALPDDLDIQVAVASDRDFTRFQGLLADWKTPRPERFHAVIVGTEITTWARDRFAALGDGSILAPPRTSITYRNRAGDWRSPFAVARALGRGKPRIADFAFEGGDFVATSRRLFVDANLIRRNIGRGAETREDLEDRLAKYFSQEIVWLGDRPGDVPQHHMMMYMAPLDDDTVAVGDVRAGAALLAADAALTGEAPPLTPDALVQAARFDRAAELLAARGFRVVRLPVVVLPGGASYVTYTNAVFDRAPDGGRVVYLPAYGLPLLDGAAAGRYRELGYTVHPVDVSGIYRLNGSLGCLVNVLARAP